MMMMMMVMILVKYRGIFDVLRTAVIRPAPAVICGPTEPAIPDCATVVGGTTGLLHNGGFGTGKIVCVSTRPVPCRRFCAATLRQ